jgi:hypothetical protein
MTDPTPGSLADLLTQLGAPYTGAPSPATPGDTAAAPSGPLTDEQKQQLEMLRTWLMPMLMPQQQLPVAPPEQTGAGESSGGGGGGSGESAR